MSKLFDLKKRIEERRRELENQITSADGKGVGTGALDPLTAQQRIKKLDELIEPG